METNWDWDYFYSGKMKEWEGCKTRKDRREWRKRHCDLAIENYFSKWRLGWIYTRSDCISTIIGDIKKAIKGTSWLHRRIFWRRFKKRMEETAKHSINMHRVEWASDWRHIETEQFEEEVPKVISSIVDGFKAWISPVFWVTKPENIIAWEFGKMPEKKTKPKKVEPSILWKIKSKNFGNLEVYSWKVTQPVLNNRRMQIEQSIEYFLRTKFPASKIRMFRPKVEELRKYLTNTIEDKSVDFLIDIYCKAYDEEMPFLCGVFGDYGILNRSKRRAYFRSRKVWKVLRRILKKFDILPVDFEGYYKMLESFKKDGVEEIKFEGDGIDSEQNVLEEFPDLILKVVHPILEHLARAAIQRAEIGEGFPCWDEEFGRGCAYRFEKKTQGGLLDTAAGDAGVEKVFKGLKTFTMRLFDADGKKISRFKYEFSSFYVYNAVYQWYWRKGQEIFDREIAKCGLWGKEEG